MLRLAFLWSAALSLLASGLGACTSAGLCTRGELGCACTQAGDCDSGSACDNGMCVESDDEPPDPPERDAGTPDAGPPPDPSNCSDDTLMGACGDFCEAFCQNQERLCVSSSCLPGDCDPGGLLLDACLEGCSSASCARNLCEGQGEITCSEFGFPDEDDPDLFASACFDSDPVCILDPLNGCSDTCGTLDNGSGGDLANNDRCEDSGEGSDDALCPRSTDCTDCGPRECAAPGEDCENHGDCCGFFNDGAFCVELRPGEARCLVTCTETRRCEGETQCVTVDDDRNFVCAPL